MKSIHLNCAVILVLAATAALPAAAADSDWQKMKDCAAQSAKMMREPQMQSSPIQFVSADNHYSPKYEHCYVRVFTMTKDSGDESLYDAYEDRLVALRVIQATGFEQILDRFCFTPETTPANKKGACALAQLYIDEHMSH